ncbi:MAG: ribose-phosphate pyrophosphokinase, partial [Clostridia bacterium]|nr:ribose-phosphate pyrophosphokinase [Clostridia bacterium]
IIDVSKQLKAKGARRVFLFATFGLFTAGPEVFDRAYEEGIFNKCFTTNLTYHDPEVMKREWYVDVNMCKYVALIVDTLNQDKSINTLLNPVRKIHGILNEQAKKHDEALPFEE